MTPPIHKTTRPAKFALCAIIGLLTSHLWSPALRATKTFTLSDSTFSNANWSYISNGSPAAVVTEGQVATGGNTGSYLGVSYTTQIQSYGSYYMPEVGLLGSTLLYTPGSEGAITNIAFSVDVENLAANGGFFPTPFAEQSGNYFFYFNPAYAPFVDGVTGWSTYNWGNLPLSGGAGWYAYGTNGLGLPSATLNLMAGGAPILFGIGTEESSGQQINDAFGVDNIKYTVTSNIPDKGATWACLLGCFAGLLLMRGRLKASATG